MIENLPFIDYSQSLKGNGIYRIFRAASWRQKPASEAQRKMVAKLWEKRSDMPQSVRSAKLSALTKGEAANIITRVKHGAAVGIMACMNQLLPDEYGHVDTLPEADEEASEGVRCGRKRDIAQGEAAGERKGKGGSGVGSREEASSSGACKSWTSAYCFLTIVTTALIQYILHWSFNDIGIRALSSMSATESG